MNTQQQAIIIATDATTRDRPGGETIETFFPKVRAKHPSQLFMADCSNLEEGMKAAELGFGLIGTTMASCTPYTKGCLLEITRRFVAALKEERL